MKRRRWDDLVSGKGCLTFEEWGQGWHFCADFDLDLVNEKDERGRCRWCGFDPRLVSYPPELASWRRRLLGVLNTRH